MRYFCYAKKEAKSSTFSFKLNIPFAVLKAQNLMEVINLQNTVNNIGKYTGVLQSTADKV